MKQYFKDWSNFFSFSLALIPSVLLYILNPDASVPYVIFLLAVFFTTSFSLVKHKTVFGL